MHEGQRKGGMSKKGTVCVCVSLRACGAEITAIFLVTSFITKLVGVAHLDHSEERLGNGPVRVRGTAVADVEQRAVVVDSVEDIL